MDQDEDSEYRHGSYPTPIKSDSVNPEQHDGRRDMQPGIVANVTNRRTGTIEHLMGLIGETIAETSEWSENKVWKTLWT